jgi:putative tryptophan/tyrosine transport system substrate-binding protein
VRRLAAIGVVLLSLHVGALAPAYPAGKTVRVGLLDYGAPNPTSEKRWNALRERLRELGYVEGRDVMFEARWAEGRPDRLSGLARELVDSKVDVVVTVSIEVTAAVKRVTSTVPIVTATGGDPVAAGLVTSLARPGGNVTGVTSLSSNLVGKRLEILKQVLPSATRVALLSDPANRTSTQIVKDSVRFGKPLGMVVQPFDVRAGQFDPAFAAMKQAHVHAVMLAANTAFIADGRRLVDLAVSHRLPLMAPGREYAEIGALASYGTDYPDLFRRAATYVDRIVRGAKPGDLPIEQPTKFELVVNLKTSRALGLTMPPSVLARADEVIQ